MSEDVALERSAYREASWRILPLIALGYGGAYIDRVNISFASLQMNRDGIRVRSRSLFPE